MLPFRCPEQLQHLMQNNYQQVGHMCLITGTMLELVQVLFQRVVRRLLHLSTSQAHVT